MIILGELLSNGGNQIKAFCVKKSLKNIYQQKNYKFEILANQMKFNPKLFKVIICIQLLFFIVNVSAQNPRFWNDIQAFKKTG